jgi:hypothetical protein
MAGTLITGGLVVDGSGAPGEVRDVAIRHGREDWRRHRRSPWGVALSGSVRA